MEGVFIESFRNIKKYANEKSYKRIVKIYNDAIKNKDYEIAYMFNIALCYIKLKEFDKAIPILEIDAMKKPTGEKLFYLAYTYLKVKNFKKALMYFNRSWSLSPENKDCEIMINYILSVYRKEGLD